MAGSSIRPSRPSRAFVAILGMGWLYSSSRDAADRSLEASRKILLESREEFRSLVEQTHTIPVRIDAASQTLVYVGPQAQDLLGCPTSDWLTPGFIRSRIHPDDVPILASFRANGGSRVAWEAEYRLRHDDGSWKYVRVILSACKPGATQFLGVMLNITERRRLEFDLQQAQKLESVGRLASGIAHEINTPIQFVGDSIRFVQDALRDLLSLVDGYHRLRDQAESGTVSAGVLAVLLMSRVLLVCLPAGLAEEPDAHQRQKLLAVHGFGNVIRSACLETTFTVPFHGVGGHCDDGNSAAGSLFFATDGDGGIISV